MIHRKIYRSFTLLATILLSYPSYTGAQENDALLKEKFTAFTHTSIQEKIFVHTDKDLYLAGEVAWFKLYVVNGSTHKPLDMSKVAYIEILDQLNKPVLQAKSGLVKGEGDGSFFLPVTLSSGKYVLRAYTNWMKNAGADYFFQKTISIINSQKALSQTASTNMDDIDIRFFPEGGNLVTNLQSRVGVKAVSSNGKSISYNGKITDETGRAVVAFSSLHAGIASFLFTPQRGHSYKAVIETETKKQLTKELPLIYNDGYVMQVTEGRNNRLSIHIESTTNDADAYVLVHNRQVLNKALHVALKNGVTDVFLEKNQQGDGISHITVFNSKRQPVCERLIFTYPSQHLEISAQTDLQQYNTRNKINISLATKTGDQRTGNASMSMSVFKVDSLQTVNDVNINTYLLLSSDLKGNIESPGWYFTNVSAETVEAMDNLMLTHGWRKFAWENIMQGKPAAFSFVPEFNGHLATGKIYDSKTGKAGIEISTYLSVPGKGTQFYPSVSDSNGMVRFDIKNMTNSNEVVVQTNILRDSTYKIDLFNPFSESYATYKPPGLQVSSSYASSLLSKSIGMQVQNIYSGKSIKQFRAAGLDSVAFYGKPDATYYLDNYVRFVTLEEVLREYVINMDVQRRREQFHLPLVDLSSQLLVYNKLALFENDPLVLLDGVPLFDISRFMKMDPRKIRKLEVVNRKYFWRGSYFDGILNWSTYTGNLSDLELDPNAIAIDYEGLQPERIFYTPLYDTEEKRSSHLPDFRNVLYWIPTLHTNETGAVTTNFYSSDVKGKYAIVVNGLSADGRSGSTVSYFEVK
jgi:hypothetical protein